MPSAIGPSGEPLRFLTAATAPIPNTTPKRSISICCATSAKPSNCGSSSISSRERPRAEINSIMLARALSHDLPMGRLRDLWLENADVSELLAPEAKARRFSKWLLRPLFWAAGKAGPEYISDPEVRSKLSLFMRSRWFEPPLGGLKMAALMYDAVNAMGAPHEIGVVPASVRPAARLVRDRNRFLRLPAAHANSRSAHHPRT